eukprot:7045769-Pyramimonas_sp.AAC.1
MGHPVADAGNDGATGKSLPWWGQGSTAQRWVASIRHVAAMPGETSVKDLALQTHFPVTSIDRLGHRRRVGVDRATTTTRDDAMATTRRPQR